MIVTAIGVLFLGPAAHRVVGGGDARGLLLVTQTSPNTSTTFSLAVYEPNGIGPRWLTRNGPIAHRARWTTRGSIVFNSGGANWRLEGGSPLRFPGGGSGSVSPRGGRVALLAPHHTVKIVDTKGRLLRTLHLDLTLTGAFWSPDERYLAVRGMGRTVVAELGATRRTYAMTSIPLAWSPNSRTLLLADGSLRRPNGHLVRRLTALAKPAGAVAWSPDGTRIAYVTKAGAIRSLPASGGKSRQIVAGTGARKSSPASVRLVWAPGGQRIAFSDDRGVHVLNLRTRRATTHATSCPGSDLDWAHPGLLVSDGSVGVVGPGGRETWKFRAFTDGRAQWSPDGSRIAFARLESCRGPALFVVDADGHGLRRVESIYGRDPCLASPCWGVGASWSPDGSQLAFNSGAGIALYSVDADDANIVARPTSGKCYETSSVSSPAWSPDGRSIALVRTTYAIYDTHPPGCAAAGGELEIVHADGKGRRTLFTSEPNNFNYLSSPAWLPGTNTVVVGDRDRTRFHECYPGGVVFVDAASGEIERQVDTCGDVYELAPAPNGGRILTTSERAHVISMSDGTDLVIPHGKIPHGAYPFQQSPTWSPDGDTIAFASCWDPDSDVSTCHVRLADPSTRTSWRLTHAKGVETAVAWSPTSASG